MESPRSYKIADWCAMRGYSRVYFYKLRKHGDAPDVIGVGRAQRITDEADARWLKRQETKAKSKETKDKAERLSQKAKDKAAKRKAG
jgi:hypothetical protein